MYLITVSKHAPSGLKEKALPNYAMSWNACEMWLRKIATVDLMWFSMVRV